MKGRSGVICPAHLVGTPQQTIKLKRWGAGKSGQGPTGWKLRPAKVLARSLAERTHGKG